MSVVLLPLTFEDWLETVYASLPDSKKEQLKNTIALLNQEVFKPILEAKDKEKIIDQCLEKFVAYLIVLISPLIPQLTKMPVAELLPDIYLKIRRHIKKRVKDPVVLARIFEALEISKEHDFYYLQIFPNFGKHLGFLENLEIEEYARAIFKLMLSFNILLLVLDKNEPVAEFSEVMKKYADRLEPFVAAFQVYLEPDLAHLKKKATEENLNNAKEYRGSIFALES